MQKLPNCSLYADLYVHTKKWNGSKQINRFNKLNTSYDLIDDGWTAHQTLWLPNLNCYLSRAVHWYLIYFRSTVSLISVLIFTKQNVNVFRQNVNVKGCIRYFSIFSLYTLNSKQSQSTYLHHLHLFTQWTKIIQFIGFLSIIFLSFFTYSFENQMQTWIWNSAFGLLTLKKVFF